MLLHRKDPSRATASHLIVPCPEGLSYDPYQIACVEYAVARRDTLVADEAGLGKTIEAIGIANFLQCRSVLVICPGYLKPNWEAEFRKWSVLPLDMMYVPSGKATEFAHVTIINYELLEKHGEHIRALAWDLLIVDESHRLKNGRTDRTRQVLGGIKRDSQNRIVERYTPIRAKRRVFLTGTPIVNGKPKEIWPLLREIDPRGLGSDWYAFAKRYCELFEITRMNYSTGKEERIGWKWDGAANLGELQDRMRGLFMIRRRKAEVMTQLPAKRRVIIPLAADRNVRKLLKQELQEFAAWAKDRGDDALLEMPQFGDFAHRMQEIGLLMVKPTIEVIENELDSEDKLVVMCFHNEVARRIAAAFPNSILVNGDVDPADRFGLTEQFQQNPSIRLLVGTIGSAGEGLTMTAAKVMLFPERDWTPGRVTQAEDRIHRRGQTEHVTIKHLVLSDSLSERQAKVLVCKQTQNDMLLDVEPDA